MDIKQLSNLQYPTRQQMRDLIALQAGSITALESKLKESKEHHDNEKQAHNVTWERARKLESKLKAAEDHAATMERCAKELEAQVEETQKTADHFILMDKHHKKQRALSVPFEVLRIYCKYNLCGECQHPNSNNPVQNCTTPDNCPLIPKVKP
jgi:hypothetical protein